MLLKVGAAMMLCALVLALVVAVALSFTGADTGDETASTTVPVEPLSSEATAQEKKREFDPGQKLELDRDEPTTNDEETTPKQPSENKAQTLPVAPDPSWPKPSSTEVAATEAPRYYPQRQDGVMTLTVEVLGLYDVPVINTNTQEALDNGVIHFPQTPMPWEERAQKNVYLAGHRLGFPGTGSRLVFYNLDKLSNGDFIVLKDSLGVSYEYRVSESFVVEPDAEWVVQPVRGRDMVTLQTCTFPDLVNRLIVRADRV
jgi:sortase A